MEYEVGDIILIHSFYDSSNRLNTAHPFIILRTNKGIIEGIPFDFVGNLLGTFKDEKQKQRKLNYEGNLGINASDGVKRNGYIVVEQLYYFNKAINFVKVGTVTKEVIAEISLKLIELEKKKLIINNTYNLNKVTELEME